MSLPAYARVRLLSDRFASEGAKKGAVGYIIEVYPDDKYEVEFSDAKGVTYAQLVASGEDLEATESHTEN
jgi:hypothetical protein